MHKLYQVRFDSESHFYTCIEIIYNLYVSKYVLQLLQGSLFVMVRPCGFSSHLPRGGEGQWVWWGQVGTCPVVLRHRGLLWSWSLVAVVLRAHIPRRGGGEGDVAWGLHPRHWGGAWLVLVFASRLVAAGRSGIFVEAGARVTWRGVSIRITGVGLGSCWCSHPVWWQLGGLASSWRRGRG